MLFPFCKRTKYASLSDVWKTKPAFILNFSPTASMFYRIDKHLKYVAVRVVYFIKIAWAQLKC